MCSSEGFLSNTMKYKMFLPERVDLDDLENWCNTLLPNHFG